FGLLREFGDAQIAWLIAPRSLTFETCAGPEIPGPQARPGVSGAAPGGIRPVDPQLAENELVRTIVNGIFAPTLIDTVRGQAIYTNTSGRVAKGPAIVPKGMAGSIPIVAFLRTEFGRVPILSDSPVERLSFYTDSTSRQ